MGENAAVKQSSNFMCLLSKYVPQWDEFGESKINFYDFIKTQIYLKIW